MPAPTRNSTTRQPRVTNGYGVRLQIGATTWALTIRFGNDAHLTIGACDDAHSIQSYGANGRYRSAGGDERSSILIRPNSPLGWIGWFPAGRAFVG